MGQPADYDVIEAICENEGLWLLDDAAQSVGASYKNRKIGSFGLATATSFFPAKPLGCYGDGGAIFTDDDTLPEILKSIRVHGQGKDKYENVRIGINGRLDTLQAAILIEKLKIFPEECVLRQKVADRYSDALKDLVQTPHLPIDRTSVWAQYSIVLRDQDRTAVLEDLKKEKIPTAIYYPKPLHEQLAYQQYPRATEKLSVSEYLADRIFSVPMHAYLDEKTQNHIIEVLLKVLV